jgi:hypothetical protein
VRGTPYATINVVQLSVYTNESPTKCLPSNICFSVPTNCIHIKFTLLKRSWILKRSVYNLISTPTVFQSAVLGRYLLSRFKFPSLAVIVIYCFSHGWGRVCGVCIQIMKERVLLCIDNLHFMRVCARLETAILMQSCYRDLNLRIHLRIYEDSCRKYLHNWIEWRCVRQVLCKTQISLFHCNLIALFKSFCTMEQVSVVTICETKCVCTSVVLIFDAAVEILQDYFIG